jgi:hypothetical protein
MAYDRETFKADRELLYAYILEDPKRFKAVLSQLSASVIELVKAVPSKREGLLRRMAKKDPLASMGLILGAWQHCRKAVFAYDVMLPEGLSTPGASYRNATARQGALFDKIVKHKITRWPHQWGESPFPGEKQQKKRAAPDFDEMLDNYDPETGMY